MGFNRLSNFQSSTNVPQRVKEQSVQDQKFLKSTGDQSKPADIRVVLDDIEEITKRNSLISELGAPQTNFSPFGTSIANESSSTPNTGASSSPPRSNVLHNYEPTNYIISLSAVSKESFNSGNKGNEILIARSGGKGPLGTGTLGKDYYIDNLLISNTISPTKEGKSGQIYQIAFTVTEPYGTSFVDALITGAKTMGFENHLKAVYKLTLQFKGVDDKQNPSGAPIEFATRVIPVHIYAVEMSIEAGVSLYRVDCLPATYLGMTEVHGVTQEQFTIKGDTVGEAATNFFEKINESLKTLEKENRILKPDEYYFAVDESYKNIVDAKIPYDGNSSSANVINISNQNNAPPGKKNVRQITVPRGTSIQSFLEALVRESTFYRSQFDEDGQPKNKNGWIDTLATKTRLEILETNGGGGGNRPVYKFIWVLRPQKSTANYMTKEAKDLVSNVIPVRTYNYLYTGQNKDILNFDITYKFGFYQAIPYFKKTGENVPNDAFSGTITQETTDEDTTGQSGEGNSQVTTEAIRYRKDGFIADLNTTNGEVATIFEQIIQDPSADLIVTTMEILGDPCWIEQKSVINESFQNSYLEGSPNIDRFGSVTPDEYEVYIQVNFKTPTDLNEKTGLFDIKDAAFFSGIYKVYISESRFEGGIFTNTLQMVRMRHQPVDKSIFNNYEEPVVNKKAVVQNQDVVSSSKVNIDDVFARNGITDDNTTDNVTELKKIYTQKSIREKGGVYDIPKIATDEQAASIGDLNAIRRLADKNNRIRGGI